ncbi:MAG: tyrosine-type recombinase/integrase [Promethearchaeota archaeon]
MGFFQSIDLIYLFHLHRHFFSTSLVERGVDFITISEILGHSKLITSFVYSHTDREKKRGRLTC